MFSAYFYDFFLGDKRYWFSVYLRISFQCSDFRKEYGLGKLKTKQTKLSVTSVVKYQWYCYKAKILKVVFETTTSQFSEAARISEEKTSQNPSPSLLLQLDA